MRRDTFVQAKEKEQRWVLFSGDPKTISIRTPLLVRMCINSGLSSVKKNHELQHGSCTSFFFYKIRGPYQENKDAVFKSKTVTGTISRTGISHEGR